MKKGNLNRYVVLMLFCINSIKYMSKSTFFCFCFYAALLNIIPTFAQDNTGTINVNTQGGVGLTGDGSTNNGLDGANRAVINVNYNGSSAAGDFATAIQGDDAVNGQYGDINVIGNYGLGIVGNNASLVSGSTLTVSGESAIGVDASGSSGNTIFADNGGTITVSGTNAVAIKGKNYIYDRQNFVNLTGDGAIGLQGEGMQIAEGVNFFLRGDNQIGLQGTGVINNGTINYGTNFSNMTALSGDSAINRGTINISQQDGVGIAGNNTENYGRINVSFDGTDYTNAAIGIKGDDAVNAAYSESTGSAGIINVSGRYAIGIEGDNAVLGDQSLIRLDNTALNSIGVYGDNVIYEGGTIQVLANGGRAVVSTGNLDPSSTTGTMAVSNSGTINLDYSATDDTGYQMARGIHGDNVTDSEGQYLVTNTTDGTINVNGDYGIGIDGDYHVNEGNINISSLAYQAPDGFSFSSVDYVENAIGVNGDGFVNYGVLKIEGENNVGILGNLTQNKGEIIVDGNNNIGLKGNKLLNEGTIKVKGDNSKGIYSEGIIGNYVDHIGDIEVNGENSYGVYLTNELIDFNESGKHGQIVVNGDNSTAVYGQLYYDYHSEPNIILNGNNSVAFETSGASTLTGLFFSNMTEISESAVGATYIKGNDVNINSGVDVEINNEQGRVVIGNDIKNYGTVTLNAKDSVAFEGDDVTNFSEGHINVNSNNAAAIKGDSGKNQGTITVGGVYNNDTGTVTANNEIGGASGIVGAGPINEGILNVTGLDNIGLDGDDALNDTTGVINISGGRNDGILGNNGENKGVINVDGFQSVGINGNNATNSSGAEISVTRENSIGIEGDSATNAGTIDITYDSPASIYKAVGISGNSAVNQAGGVINIDGAYGVGIEGDNAENYGTINVNYDAPGYDDRAFGILGDNAINRAGGQINVNGIFAVGICGDNITLENGSNINVTGYGGVAVDGANVIYSEGTITLNSEFSRAILGDGTTVTSTAIINVNEKNAFGIDGGNAVNEGTIVVGGYYNPDTSSVVANPDATDAFAIRGTNAINKGTIYVLTANSLGLNGDSEENQGTINVNYNSTNSSPGTGNLTDDRAIGTNGTGDINTATGVINVNGNSASGMEGIEATNLGTINVAGSFANGMVASASAGNQTYNYGTINLTGGTSIGMNEYNFGTSRNYATINASATESIGMFSRQNGTLYNGDSSDNTNAEINVTGENANGMASFFSGPTYNYGTINVSGSLAEGIYNKGSGAAINEENADINISGDNSIGVRNQTTGTFINAGTITASAGSGGFAVINESTGRIENTGTIISDNGATDFTAVQNLGGGVIDQNGIITINSGSSIGIDNAGSGFVFNNQNSTITVNGQDSIGMKTNSNAFTKNSGVISVTYSDTAEGNTYAVYGDNKASGSTYVTTNASTGIINVNGAYANGIGGDNHINEGRIAVGGYYDAGTGLYNENVSATNATGVVGDNFTNKLQVVVLSDDSIGVKGDNAKNIGDIFIFGDGATGVVGNNFVNDEDIEISGTDSIGVQGGNSINKGTIDIDGANGIGIKNTAGYTVNENIINLQGQKSVGILLDDAASYAQNQKTITITYDAADASNAAIGISGNNPDLGDGFVITNTATGLIDVEGDYAIGVYGNSHINWGKIDIEGANAIGMKGSNLYSAGSEAEINVIGSSAIGIEGDEFENSGEINVTGTNAIGIKGDDFNNLGTITVSGENAKGVVSDSTISTEAATNEGDIVVSGKNAVGIEGANAINAEDCTITITYDGTGVGDRAIGIVGDNAVNKAGGNIDVEGSYAVGIQGDYATLENGSVINVTGENAIGIEGDFVTYDMGNINVTGENAIAIKGNGTIIGPDAKLDADSANSIIEAGDNVVNQGTFYLGADIDGNVEPTATNTKGIVGNFSNNEGLINIYTEDSIGVDGENNKNFGTINILETVGVSTAGAIAINGDNSANNNIINIFADEAIGISGDLVKNFGTINVDGDDSIAMQGTNLFNFSGNTINLNGVGAVGLDGDGSINGQNPNDPNDSGVINANGENTIAIRGQDITNEETGVINLNGNNSVGLMVTGGDALNSGSISSTDDTISVIGIDVNKSGTTGTGTKVENEGTISVANGNAVELKDAGTGGSEFDNTGSITASNGNAIDVTAPEFIINLTDRLVGNQVVSSSDLNGNINYATAEDSNILNINSISDDEFAVFNGGTINKSNTGTWYVRDVSSGNNLSSTANIINLTNGGIVLNSDLMTTTFSMSGGSFTASTDNQLNTNSLSVTGGTINANYGSNYNSGNRLTLAPIYVRNDGGTGSLTLSGPVTVNANLASNMDLSKPVYVIGAADGVTKNVNLSQTKVNVENSMLKGTLVNDGNGIRLELMTDMAQVKNNYVAQGLQMQRTLVQQFQDDIHFYLINNIELNDAKAIDPLRDEHGLAVWVRGVNYYSRQKDGASRAGYTTVAGGVLAGMDQRFEDGLVGIYGGWANNNAHFNGSGYGNDALIQNIIQFGAYGAYTYDQFYATGVTNFNYGFNDLRAYRGLNENMRTTAHYDSLGVGGQLRLGYRQEFEVIDILPEVGFNYQWLHSQNVSEDAGERIFELKYKDINHNFVDGVFGLRLAKSYRVSDNFIITPNVSTHWVQTFTGNNVSGDISNADGEVAHVTARSAPWAIATEAGFGVEWNSNVQFQMAYKGRYNNDLIVNGFFATISYTFSDWTKNFDEVQEFFDQ
ncbi:hypothetical protein AAEX28_07720 [Lentisphaerota bacterium WC36G]|nr:hypothetical protein LJT99_10580 [Lentisphaerae bacterium WC36]